ncbi:MAG: alpha-glucan family phosphorylase, partial [Paludibacteraceae bacterium]|nr:alpha-glucan family phosphorylase [Paludibacteraceae bacterium]
HKLYGGDWENRMKQEYLLGVGGILTLNRLGIKKQVYHCNEGHAALINAQRLVDYIQNDGLSFNQALEVVRASSLYTVHTPVPAGHDKFEEGLIRYYMGSFPERMGISWGDFMAMGRENPENQGEKFSMSVFACNCSQEANGVSWLHGKVSQKMFSPIWKGYLPEELHVSYVTNGVHYPTWATSEWKNLFIKTFGKEFLNDQSNTSYWEKIYNVSDEEIWKVREARKKKLFEYIRVKFSEDWMKTNGNPSHILKVLKQINPDALTIGFGRRFATYKRAHLLFTDLERLSKIVNNPNYPVQFFFTGKAHPADGGGQNLIKHIVEISRRPEFQGKIIFLENYDMALAKRLISGVDIWLNTPTRPLEASGTSGEKAQMNGVLNFSVLDGWWLEGYVKGAGWALTEKRTFQNQDQQDQLDAATIYNMLENEIIPLYYAKNSKGFSPEWIMFIKNSLAKITPRFTTKRMIDDYIERFYQPLANRVEKMKANSFAKAKEIAAWKEFMATNWGTIETKDVQFPDALLNQPKVEEDYTIHLTVDRKNISADAIGVELIVTETAKNGEDKIVLAEQFKQEGENGTNVNYALTFQLSKPGTYKYGIRIYAKNEDLPHRMDFNYLRWVNF